jgi:hypothetical protein
MCLEFLDERSLGLFIMLIVSMIELKHVVRSAMWIVPDEGFRAIEFLTLQKLLLWRKGMRQN